VSQWPSVKAKRLLVALLGIGWKVKRQSGSHRTLSREGWADVVFAFHDGEEIGPRISLASPSNLALRREIFSHVDLFCRNIIPAKSEAPRRERLRCNSQGKFGLENHRAWPVWLRLLPLAA
jgi:predicted RNA binding protein YcfA (HicA-like mRNA interferase family)